MDRVTDVVELAGLGALDAAAAGAVGQAAGWPAGLATAGAGLLVVSWLLHGCPLPAWLRRRGATS